MLRRDQLCPNPPNCPEVLMLDPHAGPFALPCDGCPAQALQAYLASPGGLLISAVNDLDFALQAGVTIRLDEIPYPSWLLLRQLVEERGRYESEMIRKKAPAKE